jgi:pyridoxine 5-phosphate synthase
MTKLSVNVNKIATLRNSRGGNVPNVVQVAKDCERFGADGITVHPRPDERHIRYQDVFDLSQVITTEFNIEGNPLKGRYLEITLQVKPTQATLVPDGDNVITSNAGWDTITHESYLKEVIAELKQKGIRTSIFVNPIEKFIEGAAKVGADRIELYTEQYAHDYPKNPEKAVAEYRKCAILAHELGLGINAGHDLSLVNLKYLRQQLPHLAEVSIGHALIADALYYGLENTIQLYKRALIV